MIHYDDQLTNEQRLFLARFYSSLVDSFSEPRTEVSTEELTRILVASLETTVHNLHSFLESGGELEVFGSFLCPCELCVTEHNGKVFSPFSLVRLLFKAQDESMMHLVLPVYASARSRRFSMKASVLDEEARALFREHIAPQADELIRRRNLN